MLGLKNLIRKIAPTLGSALGGPLAGAATKFISEKLLGKPEANEQEIEEELAKSSPETWAKLKELDQQFKLEMRKLEIDVFKLEVEDRAGARELFKVNIWPQIILSAIFVIGYFGVLFYLFASNDVASALSADNAKWLQGVFTTILGVLTAAVPQILGFWFGSSMGSKEKTTSLLPKSEAHA